MNWDSGQIHLYWRGLNEVLLELWGREGGISFTLKIYRDAEI